MGAPTSYDLEAQLAPPVAAWLQADGYRVRTEVPIVGRWADLVGARADELVAVELKLRDWREALRQATAYQVGANRAWVAMPLAAASRAYRERWRFEAQGVGLLAVDDQGGVRAPIAAAASPRLLPFVREGVLRSTWIEPAPTAAQVSPATRGFPELAVVPRDP